MTAVRLRATPVICVLAAFLVVATGCTSGETSEESQAPTFAATSTTATVDTAALTPAQPTESPTASTTLSEDEMITAALTQLRDVELAQDDGADGTVLDPGINMDTIEVSGNQVMIEACTWHSKWVRQGKDIYHFEVTDEGEASLSWTDRGVACMNEAILASATRFALDTTKHSFGYHDADLVDDPLLADYWNDALVDDLRETRQRNIEGFRNIRFFADLDAGVPVAWAYRDTAIELVIALRYDYDERYGTYDTRTDQHLTERTPQLVTDEYIGDDHILALVLWWENGAWSTFAMEDLWAIDCDEPSCVTTLTEIGPHPNRAVHRIVDFATLEYQPIGAS